ncbi:hypothetical protein BBP40_001427 [Aspergillus hancockii]|nr:hypothetical protein BBP40_001427 [Aspergillus hancockii]
MTSAHGADRPIVGQSLRFKVETSLSEVLAAECVKGLGAHAAEEVSPQHVRNQVSWTAIAPGSSHPGNANGIIVGREEGIYTLIVMANGYSAKGFILNVARIGLHAHEVSDIIPDPSISMKYLKGGSPLTHQAGHLQHPWARWGHQGQRRPRW